MKYRVTWREWLRSGNPKLEDYNVLCSGEAVVFANSEDDVKQVAATLFRGMEIVSVKETE
jgi:hypothetical protein